MAKASAIDMLKAGILARIAGVIEEKGSWSKDGVTHYYIRIAMLSGSLNVPLESETEMKAAPETGTEVRIVAPIRRERDGFGGSIQTRQIQYSSPDSPTWKGPLTEIELLEGARFDGVCKVLKAEEYVDKRDGKMRYTLSVAAMGDTFGLRDVSKEIYNAVKSGVVCRITGRLENDLRWQSNNQKAVIRPQIIVEQVEPFRISTPSASQVEPAAKSA